MAVSGLIDLPAELLSHILEEVGGRELRRGNGSARLCVCQKWYKAAQPVYLSGLEVGDINIYRHNISKLRTAYGYSGLRPLMHKNTRKLRVRLVGNYREKDSAQADYYGHYSDDETDHDVDVVDNKIENISLEKRRDKVLSRHLDALFTDLNNFSVLETLAFEASPQSTRQRPEGPRWSYIQQSTMSNLLRNVPLTWNLKNFTLDMCGVKDDFEGLDSSVHLCKMIAIVLPRIKNVRLRMPRLCPAVLQVGAIRPDEIKLKSLIIKLHLPVLGRRGFPITTPCAQWHGELSLIVLLARTARSFLQKLGQMRGDAADTSSKHGMDLCRISYNRDTEGLIRTLDCLIMQHVWLGRTPHTMEDCGKSWWFEVTKGDRFAKERVFRYDVPRAEKEMRASMPDI
ncbi:hypothetical protein PMZ80_002772 [Knufia obscura]|uniref:F-box domain-containing protein n=1 Tax=Knufia obscura TaxID=1635080 RepID=A0ABR0RYA0_9EURO|nr:hypothetical protein PMZ80_002772 [Knufia obscura]